MREKPDELDSGFIAPFDYTDFFWTGELFVARQTLTASRRERAEIAAI